MKVQKINQDTMQVTRPQTVSKMKMHLFFAVSVLFFLAVILLVAGFRIDWYVNAQQNNNRLTEVNLTVNNESNIKPVKVTKTADLSVTEKPEVTATPVPTAAVSPTPAATAQSGKNVPVFFLSQVGDEDVKQGKGFRIIIVQDASGNQQNVDMAQKCSIRSARFSHDFRQLAFICEQYINDPVAGYINNIYLYDLEEKKTMPLTDNKFPAAGQNKACKSVNNANGPYYGDAVFLWNQDDSKLLVNKITPDACSVHYAFAVEELNIGSKSSKPLFLADDASLETAKVTAVTYATDYQGIYIFITDSEGNLQVRKINLP